jgi:hypothetical protein
MRGLLAVVAVAMPIPHPALLAIDRAAGYRNFLPTRAIQGFTYDRWSDKGGVLRVDFRNRAGAILEWRVEPISGACDAGKQQSFQLGGNKVWWAQSAGEQFAWRCVFDQAGKSLRLEAATTLAPTKFGPSGLGVIVAHANRH